MMVNVLSSIRLAVCAFPLLAAPVAVPFFCRQMRARCFNWVRAVFGGLFLFYVLCVLALVFFPLPDAAQAAKLTTYDAQLVPFQFVADFLRETPLVRSDARTYLPALFDRTVQQVVCNILMLLPFGMYLRYVCGLDLGRVALVSLAFSAFIELGQLTGLFFLFRGSYRLCDVDDLMLNTLGGLNNILQHGIELIIIDIQNHLLGHKADGSAVHAGQLFNGIFNFGGAVCTINFDFEFLLHDNISFGFMINIF